MTNQSGETTTNTTAAGIDILPLCVNLISILECQVSRVTILNIDLLQVLISYLHVFFICPCLTAQSETAADTPAPGTDLFQNASFKHSLIASLS